MHSLTQIHLKHLMYDVWWLWCRGLWVLSSVISGLMSAAPECLLPLSLEWCILLTAGYMKGFIFEVVSVVCLNGCLIFLFLSETLGWTDVKTSLPSGSCYHMKRLIFDHTTFLSTLLSNTLARIYFEARWDIKSKGSKCIDCSSKSDEILFEMCTPVLPNIQTSSLQQWN